MHSISLSAVLLPGANLSLLSAQGIKVTSSVVEGNLAQLAAAPLRRCAHRHPGEAVCSAATPWQCNCAFQAATET
jgi:hypothetical protein